MSYTIEFDRLAITTKHTVEDGFKPKNIYLILNRVGDSNTEAPNGGMVKNWNLITIDTKTGALGDLTTYTSPIEKGLLRYQNGTTKIENYLSNWRKTITAAHTAEEFQDNNRFYDTELHIKYIDDPDEEDEEAWRALNTITTEWKREAEERSGEPVYSHPITADAITTAYDIKEYAGLYVEIRDPT